MEHTHPKNDARSPQGISFEKGVYCQVPCEFSAFFLGAHCFGSLHVWSWPGRHHPPMRPSRIYLTNIIWLRGWTNPSEKYDRQNGNRPQVGGKIKNVWNHHLVIIIIIIIIIIITTTITNDNNHIHLDLPVWVPKWVPLQSVISTIYSGAKNGTPFRSYYQWQ